MLSVADRHDEVRADEDHNLAGFDDLAGLGDGFVLHVFDGFEHQKQRLVVAFQLRSLMRMDRVLDRQLVQPEHIGDRLHLVLVGFVQADPDEGLLALVLEFPRLRQRAGVSVFAGQPLTVDVDAAVDHGTRDGDVNRLCIGVGYLGPHYWPKRWRQRAKRSHRITLPSLRRTT